LPDVVLDLLDLQRLGHDPDAGVRGAVEQPHALLHPVPRQPDHARARLREVVQEHLVHPLLERGEHLVLVVAVEHDQRRVVALVARRQRRHDQLSRGRPVVGGVGVRLLRGALDDAGLGARSRFELHDIALELVRPSAQGSRLLVGRVRTEIAQHRLDVGELVAEFFEAVGHADQSSVICAVERGEHVDLVVPQVVRSAA
jgi:hypothetical protein